MMLEIVYRLGEIIWRLKGVLMILMIVKQTLFEVMVVFKKVFMIVASFDKNASSIRTP